MDEEQKIREDADDKLINDAFQRLLDSYCSSRHRKKVDIITKVASPISCTPSPSHK